MTTAEIRETNEYWAAYFAMRIAYSLRDMKEWQRQAFREDLQTFLRTQVPGNETREMVTKEMRKR